LIERPPVAHARVAALLLLLVLALGSCGGGDDEEQIDETVRDFVNAANDRDADTFCREIVTQEFLEKTTGATGDDAQAECRRQLKAIKGLRVKLVRIGKTEIDGDKATVRAVFRAQGVTAPETLRLEKQDGDWKLSGRSGGD
jgi:predicted lipid-binding transport protein (Tim44 family)